MIPDFVHESALWSYDPTQLDLRRDRKLIITQVCNRGTKKAIDWLLVQYAKDDIREALEHPSRGVWSRKSYNFWTWLFHVPKQPINFWPPA